MTRLARAPIQLAEWRRRYPRITLVVASIMTAGVLASIVTGAWFMSVVLADLPARADLRRVEEMEQATTLYDARDRPVFAIFKEQRIEIPLASVSPHLIRALLAIEDQRFYSHGGIDVSRVIAAALENLRAGRAAQGGSTITQQLVRQSFLTRDKTMTRKLREAVLAARLEHIYSKDEILQFYVNKVYFGDGLYGAEAASLGYFGKPARDLTVAEAALLAGLVKSPSTYAPTVSRERALARRAVVLQAMLGIQAIDRRTWRRASQEPLVLRDALRRDEPFGAYFKEAVRRELIERFGWQRVYQGGLRVYTSFDPDLQQAAEAAVAESLEELDKRREDQATRNEKPEAGNGSDDEPLQAALVAIDPSTGFVRAMVGGRDGSSEFNRATQARRQPGSAFKPFVYAAALESGYTAASLIDRLDEPVMTNEGAWTPEDEHSGASVMTMRAALRTSSNRAAVRMLERVGISQTVRYAKRLGVGTLPSVPSLALGSGEVTLESLTAAFASFADGGLVHRPVLIRKVENGAGEVLYENFPKPQRAVSEATAYIMATMMADVVNAGTAYKVRRLGFTLPAAGKTGTTNDYNDAWFVGFTPHLVTGVWVGFDQPRTILRRGYAGDVAVPLWARFMKAATTEDKPDWFRPPRNVVGVTVCRVSGKLPAEGCSVVPAVDETTGEMTYRSLLYTEYFVRGTEPDEICSIHGGGGVTTVAGPGAAVPPPASGVDTGAPSTPVAAATSGAVVTGGTVAKPKKKRGFWARVFGIGGDEEEKKEEKKDGNSPRDGDRPPREQ